MKKLIATLILILACQMMTAGTMPHNLHKVTLQDGRTVEFMIMGTTEFSWLQTTTGELIVQDGDTYRSATATENNALHNSLDSLKTLAEEQNKSMAKLYASNRRQTSNVGIPDTYLAHVGSPKIAVLLVNFADSVMEPNHDQAYWNEFFNSTEYHPVDLNTHNCSYVPQDTTNYSSVRQYFADMSDGKFTPDFQVFGPFTIDKPMNACINSTGTNYLETVKAACNLADPTVDFSQVDFICAIMPKYYYQYTGNKHYVGGKTCITQLGTYDGKPFYRYFIGAELGMTPQMELGKKRDASMGITCHELCHALGLPDVYPTASWSIKLPKANGDSISVYDIQKYDNQSMEFWDLMDGGEHTGNGYTPMPLSYFEKWIFGWVDAPEAITEDGEYTLQPLIDENGSHTAKYIVNPDNENEFWILENIPQNIEKEKQTGASGWYRASLSYGMLVTHIADYSQSVFRCGNNPNNVAGAPKWTIIPADSILYSSYHAYCSALTGGPYDWWFIGSNNVKEDHRTDTYPLMGAADNKALYSIKTARINGKYQKTYLYNDSISVERLKARTATEGLKSINHIRQEGGNGTDVTFIYGNDTPAGIKDINATDEKNRGTIKYINDKGQIVIVKNGKTYNILGVVLR